MAALPLPSSLMAEVETVRQINKRLCNSRRSGSGRMLSSLTIKAQSKKSNYSVHGDFCDLYSILGVDRKADSQQIKKAYKYLQKRCHPDIAGAAQGHRMSSLLNRAYHVLSQPHLRSAYDTAQAEAEQLQGYTGQTIYSTWSGEAAEQKAVFVDELRCVGCLNCAFLAPNTFAIETCHGRARAVNQWADPLPRISDAIAGCPVDCIWWVDRAKLPALEFLMSKQPRLPVRSTGGNNTGIRIGNVFADADKLLKKVQNLQINPSKSQQSVEEREAMMQVAEQIKAAAKGWFHRAAVNKDTFVYNNYWHAPIGNQIFQNLMHGPSGNSNPIGFGSMKFLKAAVSEEAPQAANLHQKQLSSSKFDRYTLHQDEYWVPVKPNETSLAVCLEKNSEQTSKQEESKDGVKDLFSEVPKTRAAKSRNHGNWAVQREFFGLIKLLCSGIPLATSAAAVSAITFGLGSESGHLGGLEEHIAGPVALQVVNSFALQLILAASVWYVVGLALVSLVTTIFVLLTKPNRP